MCQKIEDKFEIVNVQRDITIAKLCQTTGINLVSIYLFVYFNILQRGKWGGFYRFPLVYGISTLVGYLMPVYTYTGWNDRIVVLKKTTLQLYFKTFIEKIYSANLIM